MQLSSWSHPRHAHLRTVLAACPDPLALESFVASMPVTLGMALTLPFAYRTPSLRKASGPSPLSGRAAATSHSRATVRVFAQAAPSSSSPGDSAAGQAANSPSQSSMRDTSRVVARAVMEDRSVTGSAAEAPVAAPPPKFDSPRGDTRGAIVLLEGVNVRVGSESLLEDLELRIEPGEKVGLIGANGCGKSTLLKCLMGKRDIDGGRMAISPSAEVGYLEQTAVSGSTKTVYEVRACDNRRVLPPRRCRKSYHQISSHIESWVLQLLPRSRMPASSLTSACSIISSSQEARSQMPATAAALALARAEAEEQFLVGSTGSRASRLPPAGKAPAGTKLSPSPKLHTYHHSTCAHHLPSIRRRRRGCGPRRRGAPHPVPR